MSSLLLWGVTLVMDACVRGRLREAARTELWLRASGPAWRHEAAALLVPAELCTEINDGS